MTVMSIPQEMLVTTTMMIRMVKRMNMMMMMTETPHRNAGGEFGQLQDRGRPQGAAMGSSPEPCSVNSKM